MHIVAVGLNYHTAPVEIRERVSVADYELDDLLAALRNTHTVLECVVVSTCNRTEIYAVVTTAHAGQDYLATVLARRAGLSRDEMMQHLYTHTGSDAVEHLMRVTCGLDSMVIGETQILGQVRSAYLVAQSVEATGVLLNQLFRRAIQLGKQAQSDTEIGQKPVSVSYAAVQLAKKIYGDLRGSTALVIGAGSMSRLSAQHLQAAGVQRLVITNRTFERALELAASVGGTAVTWEQFPDELAKVDIVISSTGSPTPVLTAELLRGAMKSRRRKSVPMTLIDIAVPRDLEPAIGELKNVYLYDIDDLEGVVEANLHEREKQAQVVMHMVREACEDYARWTAEQEVVPLIAAIREKGTRIQANVMESLERKLPNLSEHDKKVLQKHTMSIVNQILRDPIQNMKELAIASGGSAHVRVFAELFGVSAQDMASQHSPMGLVDCAATDGGIDTPGFVELVRQWSESLLRDLQVSDEPRPLVRPALR
ncbi:glutamyl-tRNA reductase [Alicyclobacillus ferrooxydans]|uniref:glutamyl-tRNA reductase n=1 Tax=Alicyclobacillus ferrooxydans TaxID=471514 RepID=UPI0006D57531|nr:glutamyl-tRNA reductase [Alicyclobacillus ferrooxydans]